MLSFILVMTASAPAELCTLDGPQQEMNHCAHKRFLAADAELNIQWKKTVEAMRRSDKAFDNKNDSRPGSVIILRSAQRAWITFRDQHCANVSYEARGGSMEGLLYSVCKEEQTRLRTVQLKSLANSLI